jgi:hypothetical protein
LEIREEEEEKKQERSSADKAFYVCCIDESEYVYVFSHKSAEINKKGASGF